MNESDVSIVVIGAGYVGLPTAIVLAHFGHRVTLVETTDAKREFLDRGQMPIVEPGLEHLFAEGVKKGCLSVTADVSEVAGSATFIFLCVPTPELTSGAADVSYLKGAVSTMAPHLSNGVVIVNKSTVPIGATELVTETLRSALNSDAPALQFSVVSNPEFLREGTAVQDSLHPERIVVGSNDQGAAERVADLFATTGSPVIVTDPVTAETIKYASNAFLAVKLSFVNALAQLCEAVGAQANDLMEGLGHDRRIGQGFLRPGPGWGGSCLPKDTHALLHIADNAGYDFALLRGAIEANEVQRDRIVQKVRSRCGETSKVCILGLTFKAGTDDRRTSPAISIARQLLGAGLTVHAYDPTVQDLDTAGQDVDGLTLFLDPYAAATGAGVLVILTEWEEFRSLDFAKIKELMVQPSVVDARNLLDKRALRALGYTYVGIGSM